MEKKSITLKELVKMMSDLNLENGLNDNVIVMNATGEKLIDMYKNAGKLELETAQKLVGGYIEYAHVPIIYEQQPEIIFLVDDEGIIKRKMHNSLFYQLFGVHLYGDVLITTYQKFNGRDQ
jgi:hypothetical protein